MKPKLLQKLIKKVQKDIEESRVQKVSILHEIDSLNYNLQKLKEELAAEQKLAAENAEYRLTYQNYYKSNKTRQAAVVEEIKRNHEQIKEIEAKLLDDFRTMKQYEILLNKNIQAKKDKLETEESKFLDELGVRRAG